MRLAKDVFLLPSLRWLLAHVDVYKSWLMRELKYKHCNVAARAGLLWSFLVFLRQPLQYSMMARMHVSRLILNRQRLVQRELL